MLPLPVLQLLVLQLLAAFALEPVASCSTATSRLEQRVRLLRWFVRWWVPR